LGSLYAGRPNPLQVEFPHPLGQIALALWICRRPARKALRTLDSRWTCPALRFLGWRIARHGLQKSHEELLAYLLAAWPKIEFWDQPESKGRRLGAELILRLCLAQERNGASPDRVLDYPFALAMWHCAASAEEQGAISLVSDGDRRLIEEATRLDQAGLLPRPGTVIKRN
jgi:hypothetical protein